MPSYLWVIIFTSFTSVHNLTYFFVARDLIVNLKALEEAPNQTETNFLILLTVMRKEFFKNWERLIRLEIYSNDWAIKALQDIDFLKYF